MSNVSMIGLGSMGSALAQALLNAGHNITVWNRTPEKMEPVAAHGAGKAEGIAEAVQASPLIMVCIDNYVATNELLRTENVASQLSGRTLVQFSTGTPMEARELEAWLKDRGCDYLDGAIISYPSEIGAKDTQILVAGPNTTFARCKPFIRCFGGDLRHVGQNVGSAAVLDLALLSHIVGVYIGAIHGASICESEQVAVDQFRSLLPEEDYATSLLATIDSKAYEDTGGAIRTWDGAVQKIQDQARSTRLNSEFPDLLSSICKRAIAAGHGDEDFAALVKVLRQGNTA